MDLVLILLVLLALLVLILSLLQLLGLVILMLLDHLLHLSLVQGDWYLTKELVMEALMIVQLHVTTCTRGTGTAQD